VGVVLAVAAGVASASALVPQPDATGDPSPESVEPGAAPAYVGATARDLGNGPDWAVRVYTSRTGWKCPEVGRISAGAFGSFDEISGFRELPLAPSGSCADLDKAVAAFGADRYAASPDQPARLAIFGVASARVRTVVLETLGSEQPLALHHSSFLVVRDGADLDGLILEFTTADGVTTSYPLGKG
jgi:hypothetical protein